MPPVGQNGFCMFGRCLLGLLCRLVLGHTVRAWPSPGGREAGDRSPEGSWVRGRAPMLLQK